MTIEAKIGTQALLKSFILAPQEGRHIDPVQLLQYLNDYANIYAEETARPGLDAMKTELVRGQRLAYLTLIKEINEVMSHATA